MTGNTDLVDLDGSLHPSSEVEAARDDDAFFRGEGLYETILAVSGRTPFCEAHLTRMRTSARALGAAPPPDAATSKLRIAGVLAANGLQATVARVMLRLAQGHLLIKAAPAPPDLQRDRSRGVDALCVQPAHPECGAHKILARPVLRGVVARARRAGAGEALVLDAQGNLLEGATSNVFCVIGGQLVTAPLTAPILPGVTRARVVALAGEAGWPVEQRTVPRDELLAASEIFLTSAIRLLVPVVRLDGTRIGDGRPGPIARRLADDLAALVQIADA